MSDLKTILSSSEYNSLPDEKKRAVVNGYFKTRIEVSPEYANLPDDKKTQVRNGFIRVTDSTIKDEKWKSPEYQAEKLLLSKPITEHQKDLTDVAIQYGKDVFDSVRSSLGFKPEQREVYTPTPFFTKPVVVNEQQLQKNINFLNTKQMQTEKKVAEANTKQQEKARATLSQPYVAQLASAVGSTASFLGGMTLNAEMKDAGDWLADMSYTSDEKKSSIATDIKNKDFGKVVNKIGKVTFAQAPVLALRTIGVELGLAAKTEMFVASMMGVSAGGQKYLDLSKTATPENMKVINAGLTGLSAGLTEVMFGGASKVFNSLLGKGMTAQATDYAKRVIKNGVARTLAKDALNVFAGEPLENVTDVIEGDLVGLSDDER